MYMYVGVEKYFDESTSLRTYSVPYLFKSGLALHFDATKNYRSQLDLLDHEAIKEETESESSTVTTDSESDSQAEDHLIPTVVEECLEAESSQSECNESESEGSQSEPDTGHIERDNMPIKQLDFRHILKKGKSEQDVKSGKSKPAKYSPPRSQTGEIQENSDDLTLNRSYLDTWVDSATHQTIRADDLRRYQDSVPGSPTSGRSVKSTGRLRKTSLEEPGIQPAPLEVHKDIDSNFILKEKKKGFFGFMKKSQPKNGQSATLNKNHSKSLKSLHDHYQTTGTMTLNRKYKKKSEVGLSEKASKLVNELETLPDKTNFKRKSKTPEVVISEGAEKVTLRDKNKHMYRSMSAINTPIPADHDIRLSGDELKTSDAEIKTTHDRQASSSSSSSNHSRHSLSRNQEPTAPKPTRVKPPAPENNNSTTGAVKYNTMRPTRTADYTKYTKSPQTQATDSGYESATMRSVRRPANSDTRRSRSPISSMSRTSRSAVDSIPLCLDQLSMLNVESLKKLCNTHLENNKICPDETIPSPCWRDIVLVNETEPVYQGNRCVMYKANWRDQPAKPAFTVMIAVDATPDQPTYVPNLLKGVYSFEASVPIHLIPSAVLKNQQSFQKSQNTSASPSFMRMNKNKDKQSSKHLSQPAYFSESTKPEKRLHSQPNSLENDEPRRSSLESRQDEAVDSILKVLADEHTDEMAALNTNCNNNMGLAGVHQSDESDCDDDNDGMMMGGASALPMQTDETLLRRQTETNKLIRTERVTTRQTVTCQITILPHNYNKIETVKEHLQRIVKETSNQDKLELDIIYILLQILGVVFSLLDRKLQLDTVNLNEFLMMTDESGLSFVRYHMLSTRPLTSTKLTNTCEKFQLLIMQINHLAPFLSKRTSFIIIDDMFQHATDQGDLRLIYSILQYMLWGPKDEEVKVITLAENRKQAFELWLHLARGKLITLLTFGTMNQHNYMISTYLSSTSGTDLFKITKLLSSY